MSEIFRHRVLTAGTLLMLAMFAAPLAAVTFTVNSNLDLPDDLTSPGTCHTAAGKCTLRAAVMQANRTSGAGATIMLPADTYTLTIPAAGADGETNGDLNLTTPASGNPVITIIGAGAATTIIDANQLDRVLHVHSERTASISGVTLRNGFVSGGIHPTDQGGGILNEGGLTVSAVTIHDNHAAYGGAIYNFLSRLTMAGSTVFKNNAKFGGGLYNTGFMEVQRTTIYDNTADFGGGTYNEGLLSVDTSTISQNIANKYGGGIYNVSGIDVFNSSIVFNGADADQSGGSAGGIFNAALDAVFNQRNTLVAGNYLAGSPVYDDCTGTLNSFGRNLFWMVVGCTVNTSSGSWTTLNSLGTIGPLQDNGGPTLTHALLAGSNAIDGGDPVMGCIDGQGTIATDQRGQPRVAGVRCDIGAFEYSALAPPSLMSAVSRRVHGAAGTFDLPLSAVPTNPTTEPRQGPAQMIVFTFDKPINSAIATVTEGTALAGAPTFSSNSVTVGLTGVNNQQYVTIALTAVAGTDGSTGGTGSVRVGFLAGDVNQNRVVTLADLGLVNAQLAQSVTASNYLKDVNASGTLTLADKGITNANLTKALPPP
jgi:hypothetical protein